MKGKENIVRYTLVLCETYDRCENEAGEYDSLEEAIADAEVELEAPTIHPAGLIYDSTGKTVWQRPEGVDLGE
jgi:hypothetical protein